MALPQLKLTDDARREALYGAIRIAEMRKDEELPTAASLVEDARTIHAFLDPSETSSPSEG